MGGSPPSIPDTVGMQILGYLQGYTGYIFADSIHLPWLFLSVYRFRHWHLLLWDFLKTASFCALWKMGGCCFPPDCLKWNSKASPNFDFGRIPADAVSAHDQNASNTGFSCIRRSSFLPSGDNTSRFFPAQTGG